MSFLLDQNRIAYLANTQIENIFLGEYMADAPGDYVKVYLYTLMLAQQGTDATDEEVGKALHLGVDDVQKAYAFFEEWGLLERRGEDVIFIRLKEKLYGNGKSAARHHAAEEEAASPVTGEAYRRLLSNEEVGVMFTRIQDLTGNFLNATQQEMIMDWITGLDIEPTMVSKAFAYSWERGGKNFKYVDKVLNGWAKEGLKSQADVEEYLAERDQKYYIHRRVMRALGFSRNVTEEEARIINSWVEELGAGMDEILEACGKTAGIGNPNIKYVDAVIRGRKQDQAPGITRARVMDYYEEIRKQGEQQQQRAKEQVYAKVPAIRAIDEDLVTKSQQLTSVLLGGDVRKVASLDTIRKELAELENQKTRLLTENNIPIDYMDRKYRCNRCKDTGVLDTGGLCECYLERVKELEAMPNPETA